MFVILKTIVKRMANVKEHEQLNSQLDGESLKEDYTWMVWQVKSQLIAYKAYVQPALSKWQYEMLTLGVEELSDLMFGQLGKLRKNLEKKLQGELDEFFDQMIPELAELRRRLTKVLILDEIKAEKVEFSKEVKLKSAFESDYAGFDSHPEIEAEKEKFSKEVYKQCTTDYVEQ